MTSNNLNLVQEEAEETNCINENEKQDVCDKALEADLPSLALMTELSESEILSEEQSLESLRIMQLREENSELRQMIQHLSRYNKSLQTIIEEEHFMVSDKRALLIQLEKDYGISRRHACRLLNLARSTCWYKPLSKRNQVAMLPSPITEPTYSIGSDLPGGNC